MAHGRRRISFRALAEPTHSAHHAAAVNSTAGGDAVCSVSGDRDGEISIVVIVALALVQQARHGRVSGVQQVARNHACAVTRFELETGIGKGRQLRLVMRS